MFWQRGAPPSGKQCEPIADVGEDLVDANCCGLRSRELDRQWNAVEMPADRGDRPGLIATLTRIPQLLRGHPDKEKLDSTALVGPLLVGPGPIVIRNSKRRNTIRMF